MLFRSLPETGAGVGKRGGRDNKTNLSVETGYTRTKISGAAVSCFGHRLVSREIRMQGALGGWRRREQKAAWVATVATGRRDIIRRGRFWGS